MNPEPIKNISLSYACKKNWNEMDPVAGGRFCDSCQHVVYDFTNQSDCHLKKILSENKRVCGRFKRSQMSADFLKYAAVSVIVASGAAIHSCDQEEIKPTKPEVHQQSVIDTTASDTVVSLDTLPEYYLTGVVFIPDDEERTEVMGKIKLTDSEED